eukprot:Tbor_TRINITY_DN3785_c0_g3::TRINITY_DN3785_c0_g3_i1::g.2435::m.2435
MSVILKFKCKNDVELNNALPAVKLVDGVKTISHLFNGSHVIGYLSFENQECLEEAKVILSEKAGQLEFVSSNPSTTTRKNSKRQKAKGRSAEGKNALREFTSEFFVAPEPRKEEYEPNYTKRQHQKQTGQGRGGRRWNGEEKGLGRIPLQTINGHIAVIDNIPHNTTTSQLAAAFVGCGQIFDINRVEKMGMIYFTSMDAVEKAIFQFNGRLINGSIITVSNGGIVKLPSLPISKKSDSLYI